jgi:N-acetyl-alpha-D-glucosaminyl L-malate synthase BshA
MLLRQAMGAGSPAIVVTVHGTDVTGFGADAGHAPILAAALRAADVVTAPSQFLADRAREALAIECEVVPNFVDTDVFHPTMLYARGGPVRLVHVSSFRPVKATRALVPMMRELGREAHLTLVGDGPDRAQVQAEARKARLGSRVEFLGAIRDPEDVAEILSEADLFVLPSESESFGLAALEALACAVPVIARRVGGLPEVVRDGVTGVLVDRAEDLAPAILSLSPERRIEMAMEASTDTRRRFAPEVVVGRYEAVYERAIRARRGETDA